MRTLIKIITRLFIVLLFVSLTNCEKDDTFTKEEIIETQTTNFKISIFNEDDYKNNNKLLDKVNKYNPRKKQNALSREVYDSIYDFSVNTDHVNFIESLDGSIHSYTFEVIQEPNSSLIENLVFTLQHDGSYLTEFYQYEYLVNGDVEIKSATLEGLQATDYTQRNGDTISWKNSDLISTSQMDSGVAGRWVMETNVTFTIDCTDQDGNCLADNSGCDYCPDCKDFTYTTNYDWVEENADVNISEHEAGGPSNGGSNGNPPDNDDPTDDDTTTTTVTTPTISFEQQILMCINGLQDDGVTIDPTVLSNIAIAHKEINMYLQNNNCDVSAQSFAVEAANIIETDSEVDYDNEIVYNIDQKCAKEVVKKTLNNSSSLSQTILGLFNQDRNYVIEYKNVDNLPPGAQGGVQPLSDCSNGICSISINLNDYMLNNSTDIFIAKVALHETIHALLVYLFETGQFVGQGLDPNATTDTNYKSLVLAYVSYLVTNNPNNYIGNSNELQHNYMTVFIDDMKDSLYQVGVSLGYDLNSSVLEDDFLRKLVWSGSLEETALFEETFDFNEELEIYNLGQSELHNTDQVYDNTNSTNNVISPSGNQINNSLEICF